MNAARAAEKRRLLGGGAPALACPPSRAGWYPVTADDESLWWRCFGDKRFTEPFFHDSITALNRKDRRCLKSGFDALERIGDALAPTAFIFHTSRCGSTLLTQMLATSGECVVLSEPTVIDAFLGLPRARTTGAEGTLAGIVAALGQRRRDEERHFFIKLDCWHIGHLPLFRRTFPTTPFILLYREPGEILASHRRQPGRQMVPGLVPTLTELGIDPAVTGYGEGYRVMILEHLFAEACRHERELLLVNYRQLPGFAWEALPERLSVTFSPHHIEAMRARAERHSKRQEPFTGDPPDKPAADDGARSAALDALYARLEGLRSSRS